MFSWLLVWFVCLSTVSDEMEILSVGVDSVVAIGTIGLAIAAYLSVVETRRLRREANRNQIIARSPILRIKLKTQDGDLVDYTDNKVKIGLTNIGYGPAFNIHVSSHQGSSPVKLEPSTQQNLPVSLGVGDNTTLVCHWPFDLRTDEDKDKPLSIECVAESVFKTRVTHSFRLPITTQGKYAQEILDEIDFGV
jgi:hypothetical protein